MSGQGRIDPEVAEAKRAAVKLLAARARPRKYLEQRLRKRGLPDAAIQSALDALEGAGYVDDEKYARDRIEGILRKGKQWGRALTSKLIADGIGSELAETAVAERLADEDQREWACEVARERIEKMKTSEPESTRRKLSSYLMRRGFTHGAVIAAVEEAEPESY